MKKSDFCRDLAKAMGIETELFTQETVFLELDTIDSFSILAMVAFLDEKFGKQLSAGELQKIFTVKDLMRLIGLEFFD